MKGHFLHRTHPTKVVRFPGLHKDNKWHFIIVGAWASPPLSDFGARSRSPPRTRGQELRYYSYCRVVLCGGSSGFSEAAAQPALASFVSLLWSLGTGRMSREVSGCLLRTLGNLAAQSEATSYEQETPRFSVPAWIRLTVPIPWYLRRDIYMLIRLIRVGLSVEQGVPWRIIQYYLSPPARRQRRRITLPRTSIAWAIQASPGPPSCELNKPR